MAKKKPKTNTRVSSSEQQTLLDQVQDHLKNAKDWVATRRDEWSELEAMLIVKLRDDLSNTTSSKVFDPRLSTLVYSMSGRIMSNDPQGKAYANSEDDVGKTILMNLLLDYYTKNANEQRRFKTKLRLLDLYSLVYGSMFALVPWRVNEEGYIGPELTVLEIRDSFPQPSKTVQDADWFMSRNVVSLNWLKKQAAISPDVWKNIDLLEEEMTSGGDEGSMVDESTRSEIDETYYPTIVSDIAFPQVETYTEYRKEDATWITWTPRRANRNTSQPYVLRVVKDAYPDGMLPVVSKDSFPLLNSPIGIGEFARGKTLQYAINSLINLYLDGVKFSIFPPLHIDPNNVVPSSIKWGAGERWFMNNPNRDVQPMNISPQGLNTFQSTYSFLTNALTNQFQSSDTLQAESSEFSLGKTPAAIKARKMMESARDDWDLHMMDETIQNIYERWIALTIDKQEIDVQLRLFRDEIEEIEKVHPDVTEMFKSGRRGQVTINKNQLDEDYDFVLEQGSTYRINPDIEMEQITEILRAVIENPQFIEAVRSKGKDIDIAELFKRWVKGKIKDWDNIIVELPVEEPQGMEQETQIPEAMMAGQQQQMPQQQMSEMQQGVPQQQGMPQFNDPEIAQMVEQARSMMGEIPRVQ